MQEAFYWLQFIVLIIGVISILIRIGATQGKQQEKNENVEKTLIVHDKKIDILEADISSIKSDVSYIRGKLL